MVSSLGLESEMALIFSLTSPPDILYVHTRHARAFGQTTKIGEVYGLKSDIGNFVFFSLMKLTAGHFVLLTLRHWSYILLIHSLILFLIDFMWRSGTELRLSGLVVTHRVTSLATFCFLN